MTVKTYAVKAEEPTGSTFPSILPESQLSSLERFEIIN